MSLFDFTLGLSGLIAYYPLHGDGKEVSGGWQDLEQLGGAVRFDQTAVTSDGLPSYSIGKGGEVQGNPSNLKVTQPTNVKAVSLIAKISVGSSGWAGLGILNNIYDVEMADYRFNLAIDNVYPYSLWVGKHRLQAESLDEKTNVSMDKYNGKIIHVVLQESLSGGVEVFFDGEVVHSQVENPFLELINFPDRLLVVGSYIYKQAQAAIQTPIAEVSLYDRRLTQAEINEFNNYKNGYIELSDIHGITLNPIFSNRETRAQANPQPEQVQTLDHQSDIKLIGKSGNYPSLLNQQGEQRLTGYIAGTVKQEQIPASKTVYLFTQYGQLLEETRSDKLGNYRFDHLQLREKFMITAKAGHEPNLPPDYHPDTVGYITPTPYKL